eukprot:Nitzschia sp. Nitz4//scaffold470_size5724//1936//3435//NITZ4_009208-RA/size5724-processed-gene-0.0-mRNA-1//-1//CDS//3329552685//1654//frame0
METTGTKPTDDAVPDNPIQEDPVKTYAQHGADVLQVAIPIVLSEFFQNTLPVVDIAFVGNLPDKDDLAAAALATVWFNLWNSTMLGFSSAIDTFLAQAYGADHMDSFGFWTGTGLVIVMVVSLVEIGVIAACAPVMKLLGQDHALADAAGKFTYGLLLGILPYNAFKIQLKYLQSQNKNLPGVCVGFIANGWNCLFNWLMIYHWGWGLSGAPWATTLTRFFEFAVLGGYIVWHRSLPEFQSTWPRLSKAMWDREILTPFLKLAISGALSLTAEAWSFEITTILAGLIGTTQLNAHIITLSIATFLYLSFPFAIGIAASIRVGQWMGNESALNAKRSSVVSYMLALSTQGLLAVILLVARTPIGHWFSSDDEVADLVSDLIPLACVFMLGDATQATTGGVMRGLGKQKAVLGLNILAFWLLGIPGGALLTFVGNAGVAGLWWGFVLGVYCACLVGALLLTYFISWEKQSQKATNRIMSLSSRIQQESNVSQLPSTTGTSG